MRAFGVTGRITTAITAVLFMVIAGAAADGSDDTVRIPVEGRISPTCKLAGGGAADTRIMTIPDLNSGSFQYGYGIECNAPFKYSVESANGALAMDARASTTEFPEAALPYVLTVNIPTDNLTINDKCPSESLKTGRVTCRFHDSRNGIALNGQATLTLTWTKPVTPLAAGIYTDRLTFRVGIKQ